MSHIPGTATFPVCKHSMAVGSVWMGTSETKLTCSFCEREQLVEERNRLKAALQAIAAWDMLNPPQTDRVADLGWLRRLVDDALGPARTQGSSNE